MNIKRFIANKYTLSVIILVCCLVADILLHKGMSRVLMPDSFTSARQPQHLPVCIQGFQARSKKWLQGINTPERMERIPGETGGFEMDVYFDTVTNTFKVFHDSSIVIRTSIDSIMKIYERRSLKASVWLDFKNLSVSNKFAALEKCLELKRKYKLHDKMIIESPSAADLSLFCRNNFFTCYYTPFFNPYKISEEELIRQIDFISNTLSQYPASAISGYYFQYPVLKKYFPTYPVLTWTLKSNISLVANVFNNQLQNDTSVKVILYPF